MPVGKRIYLKRNLPDPALVRAFEEIPASNVADTMERSCAMHPRIRLMSSPKKQMTAGPALTVKSRAGDNLLIHKAMGLAQEGDVLIVANEEESRRSLIGEVMLAYMFEVKKIAAIVLDGPIRDIDAVASMPYPIYATGTTPGGPYKEGPGEINVPVACGGVSVHPGDIVLCDPDGVIVIPRKDAPSILEAARAFKRKDQNNLAAHRAGTADRRWVDETLTAKGFEVIDEVYTDD